MADNLLLYMLLLAALAAGFLLGRRERRRRRMPGRLTQAYVTSLNELVKDQKNLDIDALVAAIEARDDSIDTRLALGSLVRRRGEVDKAIRIHQALLARPELGGAQRSQTELELARDYMAAGLLGRAENLLLELGRRDPDTLETAQQALLDIYQREREWRRAVEVGAQLARRDSTVYNKLAHFQCELAQAALERGDLAAAEAELVRAREFDGHCPRVSLLGAEAALAAQQFDVARRLLRQAVAEAADCIPLAVAHYARACRALEDDADYTAFLEDCLREGPFPDVVEELAARVAERRGAGAAAEFVVEQLLRNPSLGGFVALLEYLGHDGQALAPERVEQVHRYSRALLQRQRNYRCSNCGFSSRLLMWQCPSCHEWGLGRPILSAQQAVN